MPFYDYRCNKCEEITECFFDEIKKRRDKIKCGNCGEDAKRIYTIAAGYVKKNRVGDIWDKKGIGPVSEGNSKAKQANMERVEKMRKDKESRIDMAREKRKRGDL